MFTASLKFTKVKVIVTFVVGFLYYYIWNLITSFCSAGEPYKGRFELFSRGCHHFGEVDVSVSIIRILSGYVQVLVVMLMFYFAYSFVQYCKSK